MKKALLIAGGAALVAGGLAWYLRSRAVQA
jgi:hypothetical protein